MFHRHPLPHEEEKNFTELVDQELEDTTDLYQQLRLKKADLLCSLHEGLHDDTEKLESAKRRMKRSSVIATSYNWSFHPDFHI